MDPALSALIGTFVGGAISLFAGAKQQQRQHSNERKRLLLEKVEEAYQATLAVKDAYRTVWSLVEGHLAAGQIDQTKKVPKVDIDRVRMLVAIYLPKVEPEVLQLESRALTFGNLIADSVMATDANPSVRKSTQATLLSGYKEMDAVCVALLARLAEVAGSLK